MPDFPFPFLNKGPISIDAVGKVGGCTLGFLTPPSAQVRAAIEAACPPPIAGFFCWGAIDAFAAAMEAWVGVAHLPRLLQALDGLPLSPEARGRAAALVAAR